MSNNNNVLEVPFQIRNSKRGPLDLKSNVANYTERNNLITNDQIDIGHLLYVKETNERLELKEYPTYGNLTGVVWVVLTTSATESFTVSGTTFGRFADGDVVPSHPNLQSLLEDAFA